MSKYLSHLSYANYLNPQQTPMVVWALLKCRELLAPRQDIDGVNLCKRLNDEALHGADFLCRMQDESGFFYMTLFDKWSKDPAQRELCAYATQQGLKSTSWQAGFRQGGGMAIAALARAARESVSGDFDASRYAEAARRGYLHLREHNLAYLDDGVENIIDDYCALLAAIELTRTLGTEWLAEARVRADRLCARQRPHPELGHYWSANEDGSRPYYHAAEAGLPVLALLEYLAIEPDPARQGTAQRIIEQALAAELALCARPGNPFALARQYVKGVDEAPRLSFFMPHHNESGYWWQGENARLASLAPWRLPPRPNCRANASRCSASASTSSTGSWGRIPSTPACWRAMAATTPPTPPVIPMRWGESATASPPASMTRRRSHSFQRRTRIGWIRTGAGASSGSRTPPGLLWPSLGRVRREMEVDMIEYWVGVDGGGTHTRARIRDRAGKLLGEGRAAGSNLELGIALAHGNVLAAIEQARIEAGLAEDAQQRMGSGWRSPPPSWPTAITPC